jgi:hypothetical protein
LLHAGARPRIGIASSRSPRVRIVLAVAAQIIVLAAAVRRRNGRVYVPRALTVRAHPVRLVPELERYSRRASSAAAQRT